jgi:hypothetical protein
MTSGDTLAVDETSKTADPREPLASLFRDLRTSASGGRLQQLSRIDPMMLRAELFRQEAEFDQLVMNPVAHRLNQPRKPLRFNDFSSPCTLVHTPGA